MGIMFYSSFHGIMGDGRDIRKGVCGIRGYGLMMGDDGNGNGDKWRWELGEDGEFKVKELTRLVEERISHVENGGHEIIWNKLVAKKIHVFVWWALKGVNVPTVLSRVWEMVIRTSSYFIWKEQNARVFGKKASSTNKIIQDVQLKSFEWIVKRSNKYKEIDWQQWLWEPYKIRLKAADVR
ncbi:hypothetical protein Tco_0455254 [Tanacetum coccineum]